MAELNYGLTINNYWLRMINSTASLSLLKHGDRVLNQSWKLEDVQKIADEFPYTFHKPSNEVVSQLKEGSVVKLIFKFESDDPDTPKAERMWVEITKVEGGLFSACLDNDPAHIKDIKYRDPIEFRECHIIDTDLNDPIPSITDKYIKRCFVTNNILYDGQLVGYLYREAPDTDDDSGWRFTTGNESDEYMDDTANSSFVSLGAVLRVDDSFLKFIEREAGVAFAKDEQGNFIELDD